MTIDDAIAKTRAEISAAFRDRPRVKARVIAAMLPLAACQKPQTADPDVVSKTWNGGVAKAAQAPDGTTLWVTRWNGEYVFFAASGASWQTHRTETSTDGKGRTTTRTITEDHAVPTGDGIEAASRAWSE